jgi:hypothetical protein
MHNNIYLESLPVIKLSDVSRDKYCEPWIFWFCPNFCWELLKETLAVDDSCVDHQFRRAIDESQSPWYRDVYLVPPERTYHIDMVQGKRLLNYSIFGAALIQNRVYPNE